MADEPVTGADPPPRRKGGLSSSMTLIVILGVGIAAGAAYLLYRQGKNSAATANTTVTPAGTSEDVSGQIATLQAEIADLQGAASTGSGSGSGSGGGGGSGTKPAMPTGVKATKIGATTITLSWSKVSGATSYELGHGSQPKITVTGTTGTLTGLVPNHVYTCHVKACNSAGCSANTTGPVVKTLKGGPTTAGKGTGAGASGEGEDSSGGSGSSGESENDSGGG